MNSQFNSRKINVLLFLIFLISLTSCSYENNIKEKWISDEKLTSHLFNFPLDYQINVPNNSLSYPILWYGHDSNNKYGPALDASSRFYTFETEYLNKTNEDNYYVCYVKIDDLKSLEDYVKDYQDNNKDNPNFPFNDYSKQEIIDGKYLLPIRLNKLDIQTYWLNVKSLNDLSYNIKDKQLIFVADSKKAIINENISTKEIIKKEFSLFNPLYLFKTNENKIGRLENDKVLYKKSDEIFNFIGKKIETFPLSYKDKTLISLPLNGQDQTSYNTRSITIENIDNKEQILIPRYQKDSKGEFTYDSLYQTYDHETTYIDIYGLQQEKFQKAFISDANIDGDYKYAYFNYEKIKNIIE